jgi:indolepyruvate ferredoxin oxidoreductase
VARSLLKLMAYKDEYEVARLFADGSFERRLRQQFEGDFKLQFHMAPPLLARERDGRPPRKWTLGPWLLPLMRVLAHGKVLRGTALDPFGATAERRLERELIASYEQRVRELLPLLDAEKLPLAVEIARVPLSMRGYGHVKAVAVAQARLREAELLYRFDPAHHPRPAPSRAAGQIRGIRVTAGAH